MWTDTDQWMDRPSNCPRHRSAKKYRAPEDAASDRDPKKMPVHDLEQHDIRKLASTDPPLLQAPPWNNLDEELFANLQ
eukprot:4752755-Pyramimonas_sp.AAC.1